jgi:gamma-glutamylputrescine oxidase
MQPAPAHGYNDTYYSRTIDGSSALYPSLDQTTETDVCVVGGGFAGLATALGLVERGKSVAVLESQRLGFGASGRNGGFCLRDYSVHVDSLIKKLGLEHAQALYRIVAEAQLLIRSRIEKYNIDCGPNTNGYLNISWKKQPDDLRRYAELMRHTVGQDIEVWPTEKIRDLYSTDRYHDALFYPNDFQLHPLRYIHGLARAITEGRGKIFEQSAAIELRRTTDGYEIKTEKGLVKAGQVVLCGSAYGGGLHPKVKYSMLPVSTYVMVTEPIDPETYSKAIRAPYAVMDMRYASNYYRKLADGRLLWGGYVSLNDNPPGLQDKMLRDLQTIYPQFKNVKPAVTWSGRMGFSTHKMPLIHQITPGLWTNTAFGGHGVCATTAGGEVVASAIASGDSRHELFHPFGFGFTAGPLGRAVAQGLYGWWRLRDYAGF